MPLGFTRSGKEIEFYDAYCEEELETKMHSFDDHDLFDVFAAYEFLAIKWRRKYGRSSIEALQAEVVVVFCFTRLGVDLIERDKMSLNLFTSIDIVRFGKGLIQQSLNE